MGENVSHNATRRTARAILMDPDDQVLLFEFHLPAGFISDAPRIFWATPGGAIEEGEDVIAALRRELDEETGIQGYDVGPELFHGSNELTIKGVPTRTLERFFLVRSPVSSLGATAWTDVEKLVMRRHKWWPISELKLTTETVFPPRLGYWIGTVLRQGTAEPREIPL
jgi:8-oxo-dGTP pyrophosphatase MutT (NUDIX family)